MFKDKICVYVFIVFLQSVDLDSMIDGIRGHELCEIMKYIDCKESKHVVER